MTGWSAASRPVSRSDGTASPEIVCEGLTRRFGDATEPAVDHVSFTVATGELVVLLGPSGCGKTTLLKMINRLYEPSEGKIWIGGKEIHALPATALRRHIGYVIQQVGLFPHMTIAGNISVVPRLLGWERSKIEARVEHLMEMVGLPRVYLKRHPRELSGGEQQRVGLARALAADPDILLMDEPFASLDAINREHLQTGLLDIQRMVRKSVLFVTHDVEEAFRLADKLMVMRKGRCVQFGTPLQIVSRPADSFVRELVGAGNLLRRLSLLDVQSVLNVRDPREAPARGNGVRAVHPEDDLRRVLSLFLETNADRLPVIDPDGNRIADISMADLHAALAAHIAESPSEGEE